MALNVSNSLYVLMDMCGGLVILGAGAAEEAASVGGLMVRSRRVLECLNWVEVGALERHIVIVAGTWDIVFHTLSANINHVSMRDQMMAMGLTESMMIVPLFVTEVIKIASHQGAARDCVALLGGRTRSAVLVRVGIAGIEVMMKLLVKLK